MIDTHRPFKVQQLVAQVKDLLEGEFQNIWVEGEVSNFSRSPSHHIYFSLVDSEAMISVAVFASDVARNPLLSKIKNGDKVLAHGSLSVYTKRGSFQLVARKVVPAGAGDLRAKLEALKKKLSIEGLFDQDIKKPIPHFPSRIAVITSPQGAAIKDFIEIAKRRSFFLDLIIIPATVQGETASATLIKALKLAEQVKGVDLVVITRGGGAFEDLFCFNDEALIRAIYACPLPVISAVGHEVDTTLCDLVADKRCETPSAAAEFITASQVQLRMRIKNLSQRLLLQLNNQHIKISSRMNRVHPHRFLQELQARLKKAEHIVRQAEPLQILRKYFDLQSPRFLLDEFTQRMLSAMKEKLFDRHSKIEKFGHLLQALGPGQVLARGYTYLEHQGRVIGKTADFDRVPSGTVLKIVFQDGPRQVVPNTK